MGKSLSFSTKKQAVREYLTNPSRDVNKNLGLGMGSISNIWNDFASDAETMGLVETAEKYGVRDLLDDLHELGVRLTKSNLSLEGALVGAEIGEMFHNQNLDLEETLDFVKMVKRDHPKGLNRIISSALKLEELEQKYGMPYDQIVQNHEKLGEEIDVVVTQRDEYRREAKEAEDKKNRNLKESSLTEQAILQYNQDKARLAKYHMSYSDSESILTAYDNIRAHDKDWRRIIKIIYERDHLLEKNLELTDQVDEKHNELNDISSKIDEYREKEKLAKLLAQHGLTIANMQGLNKIATKFDAPEAFLSELLEAYESYGGVTGLENRKAVLQKQVRGLENEIQEIQAKIRTSLQEAELTRSVIGAIISLREAGIGSNEIITLEKLQDKYGTLLPELARKGYEFKSLEDEIAKMDVKIGELRSLLTQLEEKCQQKQKFLNDLNDEVIANKEALVSLESNVRRTSQLVIQELKTTLDNSKKSSQEVKTNILKLQDEVHVRVQEVLDDTSNRCRDLRSEVDGVAEHAMQAGEKIGNLEPIAEAYGFLKDGTGDPATVIPLTRIFLAHLKSWLEKNGKSSYSINSNIDSLTKELT